MESVLAAGILRTTAHSIRNGVDVDTALTSASRGASKPVLDLIVEHIRLRAPRNRVVTPTDVRDAILAAEEFLR